MPIFTVKELESHAETTGLRIVAGKRNSANEINNVNIIDNPDSYDWLQVGDFLLTTGYVFKDDANEQKRMVRELRELNCAGLGIKIKRYWDEIPHRILDEAEKLGFPIVEIPYTYSLAQVANVINNCIFKREDSILRKYQNIHEVFTACSLNGGDLRQIADLTSSIIQNPVVITDSNWNLLAYSDIEDNSYKLSENLNLVERNKCFPKEFVESIPKAIDKFTKSTKRKILIGSKEIICRVMPVATDKTIYGYMVVWETVKKLDQTDYIAIEMATTTAALERIKTRQVEEMRHHMKQDFFDDLIQGKISSVNAVNSLAEIHGMNPKKKYVCVVIKIEGPTINWKDNSSPMLRVTELSEYQAQESGIHIICIQRKNFVLIFAELHDKDSTFKLPKEIYDFVENINFTIEKSLCNINYAIGVGSICNEFLAMGKSYMMAQEAIRISSKLSTAKNVHYFYDVMSYHMLDLTIDKIYMHDFIHLKLGSIIAYDKQHNTQLLYTLECFFDNRCSIVNSAKKMFIHRNTFIYRIDKIKKILQSSLETADEIFDYQLAIKLMKILNNNYNK